MPDSARKTLWKDIETALKEIEHLSLRTVYFGRAPVGETDVIAIIPAEDDYQRSFKGATTNEHSLAFTLRYVIAEALQPALMQYEDVAPLIKAKMEELRTDLKAAKEIREMAPQSEKWIYADADHPDTGVDLNYVVFYSG